MKKKFKIVRLTTFLDYGGLEKRLVNISHIKDSNEWVFCAINKGGVAEKLIKQQEKKVICLHLPYKIPSILTIIKLVFFLKKEKPNVLHTSGSEANFHGVLAARIANVPVIVSEEIGVPSQSKTAKKVFEFIYKISNFVLGNSIVVTNYLKEENKVTSNKIITLANPVVFKNIPKFKRNFNETFSIISVSRLEPVKNIESVLRVVKRLVNNENLIHYTIVGDGSIRLKLENLVNSLGIEKNVSFVGFQKEPYSFLVNSDLYVLTSFSEGFSNSLLEAMYCGIPSLSTKVGAADEIIEEGINGWLVNVNDDDALYEKVIKIMSMTENERIKIGKLGKEKVINNYSLEKHIDSLIAIYKN